MAFLPLFFGQALVPSLLEVLIVLGNNGFGGWVCDGGEPAGLPLFLIPCPDPRQAWVPRAHASGCGECCRWQQQPAPVLWP